MKRITTAALILLLTLSSGVLAFAQTPVPATPEPAVEVTAEATAEVETNAQRGFVRVAHWAPNDSAVDVYFNGESAVSGAIYASITGYIPMPAGTYSVAVSPVGTSDEQAVTTPTDITVRAGAYLTVAIVGSSENGTLQVVSAVDNMSLIPAGHARILAYHAVEGLGSVDYIVDGEVVVSELAYPGTVTETGGGMNDGAFAVNVPAAISNITIGHLMSAPAPEATPEAEEASDIIEREAAAEMVTSAVASLDEFELKEGHIYTIALIGGPTTAGTFVQTQVGAIGASNVASTLDALSRNNASTFLAAVRAADASLLDIANGVGSEAYTFFVPTNAAFSALLTEMNMTADALLADKDLLNTVLRYHIVIGANGSGTLAALTDINSLQGESIGLSVNENGDLVLNGVAMVTGADNETSNGVIHFIDRVLLPPSLQAEN